MEVKSAFYEFENQPISSSFSKAMLLHVNS